MVWVSKRAFNRALKLYDSTAVHAALVKFAEVRNRMRLLSVKETEFENQLYSSIHRPTDINSSMGKAYTATIALYQHLLEDSDANHARYFDLLFEINGVKPDVSWLQITKD